MPTIAASLSDVEKRAIRFFSPSSLRASDFNDIVVQGFAEIGPVYVIGGVLRDLAFFGADERPISDIDFVVNGCANKIRKFAKEIGAKENRFGGYAYKSDRLKIDFWAFSKTWAKTSNSAPIFRPKHLTRATFFDWDAIIFNLNTHRIHAIDGYISRISSRVLEINLEATPSRHGNLVRALRRLVMFDGKPGRRLSIFLQEEMKRHTWQSIVDAELNSFTTTYLSQFASHLDFKMRFLADRRLSVSGVQDRRQLQLPLIFSNG